VTTKASAAGADETGALALVVSSEKQYQPPAFKSRKCRLFSGACVLELSARDGAQRERIGSSKA
jgi:hypothetical protein